MLSRFGRLSSVWVGAMVSVIGGMAALGASASPVILPPPPPPESYPLSTVALSADGSRLAVALPDREPSGRIAIWDASEGTHLETLDEHEEEVTALAFCPEGEHLLSSARDRTVRLWDVATFETTHVLNSHAASEQSLAFEPSVAFLPDGAHAVTGGAHLTARLWDVETGNHLITFPLSSVGAGSQPVYWVSVALSPDGDYMLTADASGDIQLWDVHTAEEIRTFREGGMPGRRPKDTVTFLANGDLVAVQERDSSIRVWERDTGTLVEERSNEGESPSPAGFSPDGTYVATRLDGGKVRLTEVETGETVFETEESGTGNVRGVSFSADPDRMAVATQEGVVHLWDIATGDRIHVFDHHRIREAAEIDEHPMFEER